MKTIIILIIAMPLSVFILWKTLGNCVDDSYKESLIDRDDD